MVEVWLKYGKVEVAGELSPSCSISVIEPGSKDNRLLDLDSLAKHVKEAVGTLDLSNKDGLVVALDPYPDNSTLTTILGMLVSSAKERGIDPSKFRIIVNPWKVGEEWALKVANDLQSDLGVKVSLLEEYEECPNGLECYRTSGEGYESYAMVSVSALEPLGGSMVSPLITALPLIDLRYNQGVDAGSLDSLSSAYEFLDLVVIYIPGKEGGVVAISAGNPSSSLDSIKDFANEFYSKECEKPDVIISSSEGYPFDSTFSSSLICMYNSIKNSPEDAITVIVACCDSGIGPSSILNYVSSNDLKSKSFLNKIVKDLISISKQKKVAMVTSLPKTLLKLLGIKGFDSLSDAISYCNRLKGSDSKFTILPYGRKTMLRFRG